MVTTPKDQPVGVDEVMRAYAGPLCLTSGRRRGRYTSLHVVNYDSMDVPEPICPSVTTTRWGGEPDEDAKRNTHGNIPRRPRWLVKPTDSFPIGHYRWCDECVKRAMGIESMCKPGRKTTNYAQAIRSHTRKHGAIEDTETLREVMASEAGSPGKNASSIATDGGEE